LLLIALHLLGVFFAHILFVGGHDFTKEGISTGLTTKGKINIVFGGIGLDALYCFGETFFEFILKILDGTLVEQQFVSKGTGDCLANVFLVPVVETGIMREDLRDYRKGRALHKIQCTYSFTYPTSRDSSAKSSSLFSLSALVSLPGAGVGLTVSRRN
jgi:hypothetical protein